MGGFVGTMLLGGPELGPGKRPTGTSPETVSWVVPELSPAHSSVAARRASAPTQALPETVDSEMPPPLRRRGGARALALASEE